MRSKNHFYLFRFCFPLQKAVQILLSLHRQLKSLSGFLFLC
nr:MAG TPA: hypothetical protein [Caudoviricetes sp.]